MSGSYRAPAAVLVCVLAMFPVWASSFEDLAASAGEARRQNKIGEALDLYRQAIKIKAEWEEGWWFVGTLSYSLYHYEECESAFQAFVKLDASRALGWALLGLCEFETSHYDPALAHLERALAKTGELPPEVDAGARFHHGLLLTRFGAFERGRRELERFAHGGARESELILGLGLNTLRDARLPSAIKAGEQDAVIKAGRATIAWTLGQAATADELFRALVAEQPQAAQTHYARGAFLAESKPEEAVTELRRALDLNPHCAAAHAMLALLLLPQDHGAALEHAKAAAADRPADPLIQFALGKSLLAVGEAGAAIAQLESAERGDPAELEYHLALASAYSKAGRNADARRERQISMAMAKGQNGSD